MSPSSNITQESVSLSCSFMNALVQRSPPSFLTDCYCNLFTIIVCGQTFTTYLSTIASGTQVQQIQFFFSPTPTSIPGGLHPYLYQYNIIVSIIPIVQGTTKNKAYLPRKIIKKMGRYQYQNVVLLIHALLSTWKLNLDLPNITPITQNNIITCEG